MLASTVRLLPGNSCSSRVFDPLRHTAFEALTCHDVDLASCESFDAMVSSALEGVTTPTMLCGISMGGMVALAAALRYPEKVAGLVLIATSAAGPDRAETAWREKLLASDPAAAFQKFVRHIPANWYFDPAQTVLPAGLAQADALALGAEVYFRQQRCLGQRPDMSSRLKDIRCPTLVIHGYEDKVIPAGRGEALYVGIRNARYRLISRCGHIATSERPRETATAISAWLRRLPAA